MDAKDPILICHYQMFDADQTVVVSIKNVLVPYKIPSNKFNTIIDLAILKDIDTIILYGNNNFLSMIKEELNKKILSENKDSKIQIYINPRGEEK